MSHRLFVLGLLTLAGCSTGGLDGDLSIYQDRNPALRVLQYGRVDIVGQPGRSLQSAVLAGSDRAFVYKMRSTGNPCKELRVYRRVDVDADVRTPHQLFSSCDEELVESLFGRVSYAQGTLLAGRNLFVEDDAGMLVLERDVATLVPTSDAIVSTHVVDPSMLLVATEANAYVLERDGQGWTNTVRLANEGVARLGASERFVQAGWKLYDRDDWSEVAGPRYVYELLGDRVLDNDGEVHVFDGQAFVGTGVEMPRFADGAHLLADGVLHHDDGEIIVSADDYSQPLPDKVDESSYRVIDVSTRGRDVVVLSETVRWNGNNGTPTFRVHWLQVTDRDPQGKVLEAAAQLGREEVDGHSFVVADGARTLTVELQGTGDADLYVRHGERPTRVQWDCSPYRMGSAEVCTFAQPEPGEWFVDLVGFAEASDVLVTATVE